jgi:DNA-binding CsgD family transcriptional regulator
MLRRTAERIADSGPQLALVLAQLALELTFSPQVQRRRRLAEQALAAARASGDQRVVAQVLIRYLIAYWGPENPRERVAAAAESIAISSRLDEPLDLFQGLFWQAGAQIELSRAQDAARTLRELERIAARIGDDTATWLVECATSLQLALHGQLDLAEARAQQAVELAQRSTQPDALPFYITQIASIRWQQGRLPELAPLLAQALDQYPGLPAFRSLVCLSHALAGDHAYAGEVLAIDTATGFGDLPRDPIWIAGAVTYAHAIAELGDRDAAATVHAILDPYRGQLASTSISVWGLVDHALGRLELLLGEDDRGQESLRRAIADYTRMPAPTWRAQAEQDLASGGSSSVGGSALDVRIARLGLTSRQAEVVRLVAQGRSNKEIAAELHVAPSTVKRHLENAYDRTGARSRGALTALLLDHGSNGPSSL